MLLKAIGQKLIVSGKSSVPKHMVALSHVARGRSETVKCWRCGGEVSVCAGNVVDLQVGSFPPGDPRRWRQGENWVVAAVVCTHQRVVALGEKGVEGGQGRGGRRILASGEGAKQAEEATRQPGPVRSATLSCTFGHFRTIVALLLDGGCDAAAEGKDGGQGAQGPVWYTVPELLARSGEGAGDGLKDAPEGPCPERAAVQVFNWMGMSGECTSDRNYLPCRVYLTRQVKLACRKGVAVGFFSYCLKGACRQMLLDFFRGKGHGARGVEAPVSSDLLKVLPRVLSKEDMGAIWVVLHGDSERDTRQRGTLLDLVREHERGGAAAGGGAREDDSSD